VLKHAYQLGVKRAYTEMGLAPAQMRAAQILSGIGGGITGASGGALLGKSLGERAAEEFDLDPEQSRWLGGILGTLGGGALGGYAGAQVPKYLKREMPERTEATPAYAPLVRLRARLRVKPAVHHPYESNALQLLPNAYNSSGLMGLNYGGENFYPEM